MDFCTDFTDVTLVSNDTSGDDDKNDEDDGVSSEGIITHQSHISQVSANAYVLTQ